jgi:hypothetical protein
MTTLMPNRARYATAAAVAIITAVLAVTAGPAYADPIVSEHIVTLPTVWLTGLAAILVNLTTALTTTVTARSWVKATVALILTFLTSVVQDALAHDGAIFTSNLLDIFVMTLIATATVWTTVTHPYKVAERTAPNTGFS